MCRLLAWAGREPLTMAQALGERDLGSFTALSRQHADGWGMAWWPPVGASGSSTPLTRRSTTCAADDAQFIDLARGARSDAGFVHLRWATPGLPIVTANTHPFVHGRLAFAHNGAIHPQQRLDEILPPGWGSQMRGSTDSERYFLAIAAQLDDGVSVRDAVAAVVQRIFEDFAPTSLNAMLLAPDALYVVSAFDPARVPVLGASAGDDAQPTEPDTVFYDLRYRSDDDAVVVASSGFPQRPGDGWEPLANMTLLRIERRTLATALLSLAAPTASVRS